LTYRHRQTSSDELISKNMWVLEVRIKGVLVLVEFVNK
jgi:hypothetical protein